VVAVDAGDGVEIFVSAGSDEGHVVREGEWLGMMR